MSYYPTPGTPYVPQQPVNPYGELLRIAQRAKEDIDAGVDPGDRLESINGKIVEL
nr:MAG TPA: PDZ domain protein [Caudoviricetes sp.]